MTHKTKMLNLDESARRALAHVYALLIQLGQEEETADSEDLAKETSLSTAPDGAQNAPSQ